VKKALIIPSRMICRVWLEPDSRTAMGLSVVSESERFEQRLLQLLDQFLVPLFCFAELVQILRMSNYIGDTSLFESFSIRRERKTVDLN
jgi:hypothetical protein